MAKQRQSAVPAAVMHLANPHWQAKSRANSLMKAADWRPPLLELQANSPAMPQALLQANSPAQAKLLVTAADSPSPSSQRLRRANWRPPFLEPQD